MRSYDRAEIVEQLAEIRVPFAPFQTPADLLHNDHLEAGDKFIKWTEDADEIVLPVPPMEGDFFEYRQDNVAAPPLGADTETVLKSLNYSTEQIQRLGADGVIGLPEKEEE